MQKSIRLTLIMATLAAGGFGSALCIRPAIAADTEKKASAATFEVYKDKADEFRWRLRALNTKVIATSGQGFSSKQSCMDSIDSVKKDVVDAPVVEKEAE